VEEKFPEMLPSVEIDKDQMGQVLLNILLNAIQAMPDGGVLKINTQTAVEQLVVTISDTGEGIPAEILSKVFDPFFTTKKEGQGTGLGLWLSQKIIEQHGGTIHMMSREKQGATVRIVIPLNAKGVL
jgi:signal transduction histidine kinase